MCELQFSPSALKDLESFRKSEQQRILDGIELQLAHRPAEETRYRKRLRPNHLAEWELRLRKFRVFYNVTERVAPQDEKGSANADERDPIWGVMIEAIGFKDGNLVFIRNARTDL